MELTSNKKLRKVELVPSKILDWVKFHSSKGNDQLAVVSNKSRLSYKTLDQLSEQLACVLKQQKIKPGNLVGINFNREATSIVALVAVLKTGATYTFIDTDQQEQVDFILKASENTNNHLFHDSIEIIKNSNNVILIYTAMSCCQNLVF